MSRSNALMIPAAAIIGLTGAGVTPAHTADLVFEETAPIVSAAERRLIVETEFWGGYLWRGGDALNTGDATNEDEELPLLGGGALAAIPIGQNLLVQLELDGEAAFYNGSGTVEDTYAGSLTAGGHIAWMNERWLFGGFGGGGRTFIVDEADESDDDADHYFGGLEGRVNFGTGTLALQGGYIDSDSVEAEVFSDAWFIRAVGQAFFNDGRTMLQADLAYADGTQDEDDTGGGEDLEVLAWGLELEHAPDFALGGGAMSLFAAYEGNRIVETDDDGDEDKLTDHAFRVGLRFRFGATTPMERERNTAPDLPNVGRWMGATPAID